MGKTVVIHQPDFLPYPGFFHRFLSSDIWVILDNVQFLSRGSKSWHNRDKIKTRSGAKWITVGVKRSPIATNINEVLLADSDWREKNVNLILENYRKALFFNEISPFIKDLYSSNCTTLLDFNMKSISMLLSMFDIRIKSVMGSTLSVTGKSNELLVNILKKVSGTTYLSGTGASAYLDPIPFEQAGIKVVWQDFQHPVYPQLYGSFVPYLSSIDMFFNCGIEKSRELLRSC